MQDVDMAPIACTLSPSDLGARLDRIRLLTRQGLCSHHLEDSSLRLLYRAQARDELLEIVAAERLCCAFLRFDLRDTADGPELRIEAPVDAGVDARWLFDQFLPEATASSRQASCGCGPGACGPS